MKTITSANSKYALTVIGLALGPYVLEGYGVDAAFATDPIDVAETQMGVDGKMSAGFVPAIKPQSITLNPDSPSIEFFDAWLGGMELAREVFPATARIDVPSVGKSFICTKGILKRVTKVPPAGKVLGPQVYQIDWENMQPVPLVV